MIHSVAGFRFAGVSAGIKPSGRPDLALLLADRDVPVAAAFTRNRVRGAPVLLSQERAKSGLARALVVHSGNANACTGRAGLEAAHQVTRVIAEAIDADERRVLIAGTGPMGVRLPVGHISDATPTLLGALDVDGFADFAEAILSHDRGSKIAYAEVGLGRVRARLLGCAKGSSLVGPNLATTLAFVATDAVVDGRWLRGALREEAELTLNEVSVDGESSPNDSLFLLASGRADNLPLDGGAQGRSFRAALRDVLEDLALQILGDGAGASHVVTVEVAGAIDAKAARQVARRICHAPTVKAAIHAADPYWGAIVCAVGSAGVELDPDKIDVDVGGIPVVRGGRAADPGADAGPVEEVMRRPSYTVRVHLHGGRAEGRHVTCDLSREYLSRTGGERG